MNELIALRDLFHAHTDLIWLCFVNSSHSSTPFLSKASDLYEFGNSWAVEDCAVVPETPDPCGEDQELRQDASDMCSALNNGNKKETKCPSSVLSFIISKDDCLAFTSYSLNFQGKHKSIFMVCVVINLVIFIL